ncbi:MAG: 30S ribosomal protein S17 [Deltaproteobacteria bacterium]|jgi:small subunit ribosomal protein S17|nr:30S ribosomal protein S17 [Deltaproteobacteria bacterium]MCL5892208.1 30S ribosomal protein S17 [Deltaproteobacteria bacterium]MDA8053665.1 30S ribosomal protein S17 [Deltaproteobacteria bacterium]MDA8273697.1 30S ribosomal protein S17 [Deltaproteobacteria bacterium]
MKKTYIGIVTSDKMDKTIVAVVSNIVKHPLYKKYVKKNKKFKVHDEKNTAKIGDKVLFIETRPLSKEKRWNLKKILEKQAN